MGEKRLPVTKETRERVKARKRGDETYDDVINRLLGDEEADFNATAEITPTLDEDALDEMAAEIDEYIDPSLADLRELREDIQKLQELAEQVPERTANELEGRFR